MARLSLILLSLLSLTAHAEQERWFEVEVYIFKQSPLEQEVTEQWSTQLTPINTQHTVDLIAPIVSPDVSSIRNGLTACSAQDWATNSSECNAQLTTDNNSSMPSELPVEIAAATPATAQLGAPPLLLASSQSQFSEIIDKISAIPGNRSLLHMSWQQAMQPRNQAVPLHLYAGHNFADSFDYDGQPLDSQQQDAILPQFAFLQQLYTDKPKQAVWQLDGRLNIYLNHYLYIDAMLNLREQGTRQLVISQENTAIDDPALTLDLDANRYASTESTPYLYAIPLKQNRRVRSGEIHYFDHPKLGMIIQIRKMEQPTPLVQEALPLNEQDLSSEGLGIEKRQ